MIGAPKPLYIQYCGNDQLFTPKGMKDADQMISNFYNGGDYRGDFYPVRHSFTVEMQDQAFDWLAAHA